MKISPKELQQIIKEEAVRIKKRMILESEKAAILTKLQEMEECEMMEDASGGTPPPGDPPSSQGAVVIKPQVAAAITRNATNIVSTLSPQQLEKVASELSSMNLLGASEDQVKSRVEEMLPMNESTINEVWDKSKMYNWLIGSGIGTILAGLITAALGSIPTEKMSNLADFSGGTVHPTNAVITGLIALVLGAITTGVSAQKKHQMAVSKPQLNQAQIDQIARRKAIHGK